MREIGSIRPPPGDFTCSRAATAPVPPQRYAAAGEHWHQLRLQRGFSLEIVARKLGGAYLMPFLRQLEEGMVQPSPVQAEKLRSIYGVTSPLPTPRKP